MLFRQLFDRDTCTYSYLLADPQTGEAVLIDPVLSQIERDLQLLRELNLTLLHTLETHVHADHITAAAALRDRVSSRAVVSAKGGASCADRKVGHGDIIQFGAYSLQVRETPGHTPGCVTFVTHDPEMAFTGDALMVRGCGRTDFQGGDARTLYNSVQAHIFSLPAETRIYPGHDYNGRSSSTVAEEKRFNPRLGGGRSVQEFTAIMNNLNLANPDRIDQAVPANLICGAWAPLIRRLDGFPEVHIGWVASEKHNHRVIDVRSATDFDGPLGQLEDAELVPLETLALTAREWDRSSSFLTICHLGKRSAAAAAILAQMGFSQVASVAGGMMAWNAADLPTA
jgi:glyoxylase-like metal-dependent hydrolase (beta-lactamase superfamily II)/rhodanese-related sulfurtransferase